MRTLIITLFILSLGLVGCNPYEQTEYKEYYVVESYLVANRVLPQIRLSTTSPIEDLYTFEGTAISEADVEVRLITTDGNVEDVFTFTDNSDGIYLPDQPHQVLPSREYQLYITIPETGDVISGTTFIPSVFAISDNQPDSLVYQGTEQIEITMTESEYLDRQSIYIFNVVATDLRFENLTPIYTDFFDDETEVIEDYEVVSSGILNEASLTDNLDGTITVKYPWIGIAFYGENKVVANAIDDNIYDFIRSESVQLGGSTLSPGEIANVITHIDGGLGVFGSFASDTITTVFTFNTLLDY